MSTTKTSRRDPTALGEDDEIDLAGLMILLQEKSHYRRAALLAVQPHLCNHFTIDQLELCYEEQSVRQGSCPRGKKSPVSDADASAIEAKNQISCDKVMKFLKEHGWKAEQDVAQHQQQQQPQTTASVQSNKADENPISTVIQQPREEEVSAKKKGNKTVKYHPPAVRKSRRANKGSLAIRAQRKKKLSEFYKRYIMCETKQQLDVVASKERTVRDYCQAWVEWERVALTRLYGEELAKIST